MLVAKKILSESLSGIDDVMKALRDITTEVDELLSLQNLHHRQIRAISLEINFKGPSVKNSPQAAPGTTEKTRIQNVEKLRKNYSVVQSLWETQEALDAMTVRVNHSFSGQDVDTSKAINELEKLKKKVQLGLKDAFAFLASLAEQHLPPKFAAFNQATSAVLAKSIVYESIATYTYVYEVDGDICFSTYFRMSQVQDDDGTYYPELYVITSFLTGLVTQTFVGVSHKFAPPTDRLLMKKVTSIKDTLRALNLLLSMDNFSSSIGAIPMSTLLKTPTVDRSLLAYQQYVKAIEIKESAAIFTLKPEVQAKDMVDRIANQIYLDFKVMTHKSNARLSMGIRKAEKCWIVTFHAGTANGSLHATEDDLQFIRDRFGLSEMKMREIVRTINSGAPL